MLMSGPARLKVRDDEMSQAVMVSNSWWWWWESVCVCGGGLRGRSRREAISVCFVDINFKFTAAVRFDCWTKSIIN